MYINISKVNFTSIGINIANVDFGRYDSGGEPQLNGLYITPAESSAISVTPNDSYYTLHGKYLKYSLNGKKWKNWNGSVTIEPEQKMYLKGEDDYVWNISKSGKLITSDGYYNVGGDISSLTNFITEVKEYTFSKLFYNDSYIKDASNLILPATKLATSCYNNMLYGCSSLTVAPTLNATTLASYCYSNMFQGCSSLTTTPELPATTLTDWCYSNMFSDCTSLTTAPELPATTLADGCYSNMFHGCTSLTTVQELPATTLTYKCYQAMFRACTSLTTAPELPATTLANFCYNSMFNGCTSLTTAPELPATTLVAFCYQEMFSYCSKLNNITMLSTDISEQKCLFNWVNGVSSTGTFTKAASMNTLPTGNNGIPAGWTVKDYGGADYSQEYMTLSALGDGEIKITIPASINSTYATSLSYSKDKSSWTDTIIDDTAQTITIHVTSGDNVYLKGIAKRLGQDYKNYININSTANINASGNIMSLLYGDDYNGKTSFPEGTPSALGYLFRNNNHLINAKELILPATTLAESCYSSMFYGCSSLITAPELPATTLAHRCYSSMFKGCSSLITAPELHATTLADNCYTYMLAECSALTTAPVLPATTLASSCYYGMFSGCSSLTTAPELPATTLVAFCYQEMFSYCSKLNNITMLSTDISAPECLFNWVNGVASTGTFTKSPEMTSLPTGVNGIPSGWTVVDYGAA